MYQKVAFCITAGRSNESKMDVHITVVRSVIVSANEVIYDWSYDFKLNVFNGVYNLSQIYPLKFHLISLSLLQSMFLPTLLIQRPPPPFLILLTPAPTCSYRLILHNTAHPCSSIVTPAHPNPSMFTPAQCSSVHTPVHGCSPNPRSPLLNSYHHCSLKLTHA